MKLVIKKQFIEIVILLKWALVYSVADADKFFIPEPSECSETGGSGVPIPTSALKVTGADYSSMPSVQYQAETKIKCAAIANTMESVGYTHKDGVCSIYGPGQRSFSSSILYFSGDIYPPGNLEYVSLNKPTYSSPPVDPYVKERSVDGNTGATNRFVSGEAPPWLLIDLEETRIIHQVQIILRTDCCAERFLNIEVRIGNQLKTDGNFDSYTLMSIYKGPATKVGAHILCSPVYGMKGQYVSIQKTGGAYGLEFAEVLVYAKKK